MKTYFQVTPQRTIVQITTDDVRRAYVYVNGKLVGELQQTVFETENEAHDAIEKMRLFYKLTPTRLVEFYSHQIHTFYGKTSISSGNIKMGRLGRDVFESKAQAHENLKKRIATYQSKIDKWTAIINKGGVQ